jgi:hypothetical protein
MPSRAKAALFDRNILLLNDLFTPWRRYHQLVGRRR